MYTVVTVNWERLLGLQARSAPESIPMQGLPWQGETLRYGFSGHETFPFRYAWLPKGVAAVREDPKAFSQPDALVRLGVGKNMVASIRFWCESLGLIDVRRQGAELTPLGELLFGTATDLTAQEKDSHDLHLGADPFQIITRWRAKEIAAGVSDLDVLQVAHDRPNTELALLDDLHAKLYLADEQCLVGSANLTGSALGWSNRSNIEILIPARQIDAEVAFLLERLRAATPATTDIRSEVEAAAAALQSVVLDEAQDMTEENEARRFAWLPRCAAPDKLYEMYRYPDTTVVVRGTKEDGLADLQDLHIQPGLSLADFEAAVQRTLLFMPAFSQIIEKVPQGLTDASGVARIEESRSDLVVQDAQKQWHIVRDWIGVFFRDRFEVAPESFVTRLKSRR